MQQPNFEDVMEKVLARDTRYPRDAYFFIREALDFTQKAVRKANKGKGRHISGQELLAGIRTYALDQYGPMALMLLEEWNIRRGEDFGELVFNLVEQGALSKTDNDTRADFQEAYDFQEAFKAPFLPSQPRPPKPAESEPAEA